MNYSQYLQKVADAYKDPKNADLRLGQLYINVLAECGYNVLVALIIGTDLDPFYTDENLERFCKWVELKLKD
jgi:hypothetical protein